MVVNVDKKYRFWITIALIIVALVFTTLAFVLEHSINNFMAGIVNTVILAIVIYWLDFNDSEITQIKNGG